MAENGGVIRVNRAPVLTLWAAIVAERLGHDADAAITLGHAIAGSSARVKARAIGLEERREDGGVRDAAKPALRQTVHLLGRDLPVAERNGSATRSTTASRPLRVQPTPTWKRRSARICRPCAGRWRPWRTRCRPRS